MNARHELAREAEGILYAAGFRSARAQHFGPWWIVSGTLPGGDEASGHTRDQVDPQDPREVARNIVARLHVKPPEFVEEPAAPETVEPTFAPEDDPLAPFVDENGEEEQTLAHETHGETGAAESAEGELWGGDSKSPDLHAGGADARPDGGVTEGGAAIQGVDIEPDESAGPGLDALLDAEFTEEESLSLGDETDYTSPLLDFEPEAEAPVTEEQGGAQFIFGDNLDQMRTAAIGLVMRHARSIMPPWTTNDDAALIELRNFTMGVSEGRWPDDPARRDELAEYEATLSRLGAIVSARDAKVEFLEGASREEIQDFDATVDWP